MKQTQYFHDTSIGRINLKQDIRLRMCQKILYHSSVADDKLFDSYLTNECGLQLDRVSSRDELVKRLGKSLGERVAFKRSMTDLNKVNSSTDNCIKLPNSDGQSGVLYQIGIERSAQDSFEFHMTDSAGSSVIHVPYTQGSTYNEYKLPSSDLNIGSYLIEICIANAYTHSIKLPPSPVVTNTTDLSDNATTPKNDSNNNNTQTGTNNQAPHAISDVKWLIRPYPTITGVYILPIGTAIVILLAFFCTNVATTYRISEASESGLHRYSRLTGLPSGYYWLSEFLVSIISNLGHSLIVALMLGVNTGEYPYDPICDVTMTLRWLLLFTYSLVATSHAIFIGSLFVKSTHAVLTLCLLATTYGMNPLLLILQWTPYGFRPFTAVASIALFNPGANFETLCAVLISVAMQTGESFDWTHLSHRIVNGGFSDLSVGELWALMVAQILVWLILTILIDQYQFSTTTNPFEFIASQVNELCCCNSCGPQLQRLPSYTTKTKSAKTPAKSSTRRDLNRVCCSLRGIQVSGPTKMMPYTKGNPLRLTREQVRALRTTEQDTLTKTTQYLINRRQIDSTPSDAREEPIFLDEAIQHHIVWYKTHIKFDNLDLDFCFNQVTFILGQTDLKELLFETLLGLYTLNAGHVTIDNTKYTAANMNLARNQIGYLSDKDIFYQELSIFENLQLFGSLRDPSYKSYDSESLYVLSLLHLSHRRNDLPSTLTHRSNRKLALAVALVGYTKLLLLTEPTLNLRWRPRCQVYNLLKKYKSIRSIVVDTSDIDEAVAFGDRVVLLKNGSTDINGEPQRLVMKLGCGYWLVFEPIKGDGRTINSEAIKALEKLTYDVFKQDKIDLDTANHSIYQDPNLFGSKTKYMSPKSPNSPKSPKTGIKAASVTKAAVDLHRAIVIVKIRHTNHSEKALCTIMRMFSETNIHGFRLAQVNYESLEDTLVLRMSRAIYPDLPPDLLLSLQHRTQVNQKTRESMPSVSVRRLSVSLSAQQSTKLSIFDSNIAKIIKDRFSQPFEIILIFAAIFSSFVIVTITLLSLKYSLKLGDKDEMYTPTRDVIQTMSDHQILQHTMIDRLYKYRIGFYILNRRQKINDGASSNKTLMNGNLSTIEDHLLESWPGNRNLRGKIDLSYDNKTDAQIVATIIDKSKDFAGALIIYDPRSRETIVIYEPHLPHMLLASIRRFLDFALLQGGAPGRKNQRERQHDVLSASSPHLIEAGLSTNIKITSATLSGHDVDSENTYLKTSRYNFYQSWHEIIQGFPSRRLIYGIGFAIAEAISVGVLVVPPIRHRNESRSTKVQVRYWLRMALVDLFISSLTIAGYVFLFISIEGISSGSLIGSLVLVLFIYKLAVIPIPYMTSLVAESSLYGFLFIVLLYFTVAWDLAIFIRSFVDWTIISSKYTYTVTNWLIFGLPITALIESLVVINQVNDIEAQCQNVPAFASTRNSVELDGAHRYTILDSLLEKVRECLASGKTSVTTDVFHSGALGILWSIYLILLFALISWIFLVTCERFFGLVVRKFSSMRSSNDPMKTVVRLPDPNSSLFAWDKERDRLVSEYVKCMNEIKYVNSMAKHCLILRVWFKPMDDRTSMDGRVSNILDPLISFGCTRNELQVELRTTLQVFIRIGDEAKKCRVDKIGLIEAFSKYATAHSDMIAKFAVVDWTRENLYKILLHGYYNNKSVLS
jgi:ABC-type multidrug transport system ATPase subunit